MAGEQNNSGIGATYLVPALLAALALVGSWGWHSTLLTSERPFSGQQPADEIERPQNIEARLWQEPMAAVEEARRAAAAEKGGGPKTAGFAPLDSAAMKEVVTGYATAFNRADPDRKPGVRVLLALMPGTNYAEQVEARMRMRHAVVSALSSAGYRAEDEEHLGAWQVNWPSQVAPLDPAQPSALKTLAQSSSTGFASVLFPFEWFQTRRNVSPNNDGPDRALVVWLPDSLFDPEPLTRLSQLIAAMKEWDRPEFPLGFSILGPHDSSMLREMLPWDDTPSPFPPPPLEAASLPRDKALSGVKMFSHCATAMDGLLVRGWQTAEARRAIQSYLGQTWGLEFINTTSTDDQLSAQLLGELERRGVDLSNTNNHAVLLHEWDTFYGRTLPLAFAAEVRRRQNRRLRPETDETTRIREAVEDVVLSAELPGRVSGAVENLHSFTYLRGIDGKLARETEHKETARTPPAGGSGESKKQNSDEMNRAEGQNQLDYIPRVALELQRLRDDLHVGSREGKGAIKAIGLMGSDFYDKLLILQALRPHFPDVVFFTTDLDARYLDPQFQRWTRNLVVCSSFGLTMHPYLQRDVPPFRDNYQTSAYYATLAALGTVQPQQMAEAPISRLFEIGRIHAVDLSIDPDLVALVQPQRNPAVPWHKIIPSTMVAILAALLLVIFAPPFRNRFKPLERSHIRQLALLFTGHDLLLSIPGPPSARAALARGLNCLLREPGSASSGALARGLESLLRAAGPPTSRVDRACWLSQLRRLSTAVPPPVDPARLALLTGKPNPWWNRLAGLLTLWSSRTLGQRARETRRLALRRLALESWLPEMLGSCAARCRIVNQKLETSCSGAACGLVGIALFCVLMLRSAADSAGEPFSLEGISTWPCEILRLTALTLTVIFASKARLDLRMDEIALTERYFLRRRRRIGFRAFCLRVWRCWRRKFRGLRRPLAPFAFLWAIREHYPAIGWRTLAQTTSAERIWSQYRDRSRSLPRLLRSGAHFLLYFLLCSMIYYLAGDEVFVPARGHIARNLDKFLLLVTVVSFLWLNFLVADAVRLARTFILHLTQGPTIWPALALAEAHPKKTVRPRQLLDDWLDIQFIGRLTHRITRLVYYPAIVLCLLIMARTHYFDDWSWPFALILIFTLNSAWPIVSAFLLQTAARKARAQAVANLEAKLAGARERGAADKVEALQDIIERIEATREGAFANYLDNPALKALLVPFTGAGVMNLVNLLSAN